MFSFLEKKDAAYYAKQAEGNFKKMLTPKDEFNFPWSRKKDTGYYAEKTVESTANAVFSCANHLNAEMNSGRERREVKSGMERLKREVKSDWKELKKAASNHSASISRDELAITPNADNTDNSNLVIGAGCIILAACAIQAAAKADCSSILITFALAGAASLAYSHYSENTNLVRP